VLSALGVFKHFTLDAYAFFIIFFYMQRTLPIVALCLSGFFAGVREMRWCVNMHGDGEI
jgi:hypothetical protein